MKRTIIAALLAASLSSAAYAAPSPEEEKFALEAASLSLLGVLNCDLPGDQQPALMKLVDKAYEASGVNPSNYPSGEWTRKVFFFISGNSFYSAVLNKEPASVASFCKILHEKIIPLAK
jgi:hypothetical protein